jgi:hypothetical protein
MQPINLATPLSLKKAFAFPLQNKLAKREVLIGGLWLLAPVIGWILNMGHRIMMVHKMQNGKEAWPSWNNYNQLFKHGFLTFLGMIEYHLPALFVEYLAWTFDIPALYILGAILWGLATIIVPGYMSHYCLRLDSSEIFNPLKACKRVIGTGRAYWKAWGIVLVTLTISILGFLCFGIGFLFTSVWFWQVAGFSFATVFTQYYSLGENNAQV